MWVTLISFCLCLVHPRVSSKLSYAAWACVFPVPGHGYLAQIRYPDTPFLYLSRFFFLCWGSYMDEVLDLGIDLA